MKIKITKEEYDKLSDDLKKEFTKDGDDYNLKLEDEAGADLGSLRNAKDHEKKRRHDAEKKIKDLEKINDDLEEKVHQLEIGGANNTKAVEEIQKKFDDKLTRETTKLQSEVDKRDNQIKKLVVDKVASDLAAKISTVPKAMERVIKERLTAEWDGDEVKTGFLDADGKPAAITMAEFEKEIISNSEFSAIIKGSQASGSGAGSGEGGNKSGAFSLESYQNEDKSVNWGKVAETAKTDPGVIAKVKEAIGQ